MKKEILCKTCFYWVDCSKKEKTHGFCLMCDLFTYTKKTKCRDYINGKPMTEKEFESR